MAKKKRSTREKATKAEHVPQILDLSTPPKRPIVKLPTGDHELRVPEELTFDEFAEQQRNSKAIQDLAEKASDPEVLEQLQALVAEGVQVVLVGISDEDARAVTPGMFLKISAFFRELGDEIVTTPGESGTASAAGSNGSTEEDQEAA
ncbi:hypothetical protein LCGC14_1528120 [marine sediment metagenome]|uniref:Tail assembly chaperone n=1 Tax=marine sediment metagenome TaxID=412755 RepID=A0A0F9IX31_9ZZZZ